MHPDHLNTPRLVADSAGAAVWRWDQVEPFGVNVPDENPSGLGAFEFPLRFPGQYADEETNNHYNYYRDYDPSLGIYKQSDPIGLRAGLNTYSYVAGNPIGFIDPDGLQMTRADRGRGERPGRERPDSEPQSGASSGQTPAQITGPNAQCYDDCMSSTVPLCLTAGALGCGVLCIPLMPGIVSGVACGAACACAAGSICGQTSGYCTVKCGGVVPPQK